MKLAILPLLGLTLPPLALIVVTTIALLIAANQWSARRRLEGELRLRDDELIATRLDLARGEERSRARLAELEEKNGAAKEASAMGRYLLGSIESWSTKELRALRGVQDELRQGLGKVEWLLSHPDGLRGDLQRQLEPVSRSLDDAALLRETLRELLEPMLARDRLGKELSEVAPATTLGELPTVLDAIAAKGGFSTVVLSDDVGLPLAANTDARGVDALAGVASFFLRLADRAALDGAPRPQAMVALDQANQHVLHRIFTVDSKRFTLSAISRGIYVSPGALDVALGKLERPLGDR